MDRSRDTQRPRAPRSVRLATAAALLALAGLAFTPLAGAIQYQVPPPILSPTHPNPATWYSDSDPEFLWSAAPMPAAGTAYDTPGFAISVAVDGDYAYVGDSGPSGLPPGLSVVDVRDPDDPSGLGWAGTTRRVADVEPAGGYVYAAVDTSGVAVFDVSTPSAPATVTTFDTPNDARALDLEGDVLYVADSTTGIASLDVSDPTSPSFIDSTAAGNADDVEVAGNVAYVAGRGTGLVTVDVSDPTSLTVLGSFDTSVSAVAVSVQGRYAYVADGTDSGFYVIDVRDPSSPSEATFVPLLGQTTTDVLADGDRLYVGWGGNGLRIYDISDPTDPVLVQSIDPGYAYAMALDGPNLFYTDGRLKNVRVWEPSQPLLLGVSGTTGVAVSAVGDHPYAYSGEAVDVNAVDVSDPVSPTEVGTYDPSGGYYFDVEGDVLYTAADAEGLRAIDISEPGTPTALGSYTTTDSVLGVAVEGDTAFAAAGTDGLIVLDVTDPSAPSYVASHPATGSPQAVTVRGDLAYVSCGAPGMAILDVSDPTTPTLLSIHKPGGGATADIKVAGDYAYVAHGGGRLRVVDVSEPTTPTDVGYAVGMNQSAKNVQLAGDYAYVASSQTGSDPKLFVIDISDPTSATPTVLFETVTTGDALYAARDGRHAYVAAFDEGMEVYALDHPAGVSYALDQNASTVPTATSMGRSMEATYTGVADGQWFFHVRLQSGSGEWGPASHRPVRIDTTPPSTSDDAPSGWVNTDVGVTLTTDDGAGSGAVGTRYSLDGSGEATYTAPVAVTGEGVHSIEYRSADFAMNVETTRTATVRIDKTKPVTTTDADTTHEGTAEVTLSATDSGGSGVDATYYSVDNGPVKTYSAPFDVEGLGSHTLEFFSEDVAGNQEASKKVTFDIVSGGTTYVNVEGATRYDTAIAASQKAFADRSADVVIIATGENWPDALGGAALAGAWDAPILLTPAASLPGSVANEIARLGAKDAIILGGPGAVSAAVGNQLLSQLGAGHVFRLGGATRYDTADLVAEAVARRLGTAYDGTAFVTTGLNFPDALAGSPLAAAGPWPIFLVPDTGTTASTQQTAADIGVEKLIILGGEGVVTPATMAALEAEYGAGNVERLAGPTRYETAWEVASFGVDEAGLSWDGVAIATGENFPDALSGGALQGQSGSVMALTLTAQLPPVVSNGLAGERDFIEQVRFLGGTGAVSQDVRDQVAGILK